MPRTEPHSGASEGLERSPILAPLFFKRAPLWTCLVLLARWPWPRYSPEASEPRRRWQVWWPGLRLHGETQPCPKLGVLQSISSDDSLHTTPRLASEVARLQTPWTPRTLPGAPAGGWPSMGTTSELQGEAGWTRTGVQPLPVGC